MEEKDTSIIFWFPENSLILPCTKGVPQSFIDTCATVDIDTVDVDNANKPIDIDITNITVVKHIKNSMFVDILIGYIIVDIDIVQLCYLINYNLKYINISKDTAVKYLRSHIESVGIDTYVWNQISNSTQYTYYQFKKRNWPVKRNNNINWQTIANKIGLAPKIYPGEENKDNVNGIYKNPENINPADEVKRLNEQEEELDAGSDLDDDNEYTDILKLLNVKERHIKRDEKLRKLRLESNYATYSIPNIKEIENNAGFTKEDVVNVFDAAINIGQKKLALLYACKLFISRKYYHLAIKNVEFMKRIKTLMVENLRIHRLVKYVMHYSFYMILKEERLLGRNITGDNRAIMDEEEIRNLPVFDCELEESPYFTEIYHNDKDKSLREQLPMYLHGSRRFTDKTEFSDRLSIMTGNMLNNIDLSEYGAFLTGSSLVPCVVTNPIEENFKHCDSPFAVYVEHFYPSYSSISTYRKRFDEKRKEVISIFDERYKDQPNIKKYTMILWMTIYS